MKRKVCLVTCGALPIPDVKGGAIERLVTMLIEENEVHHRMDLTVLSCYDKEASQYNYQYSYINTFRRDGKFMT